MGQKKFPVQKLMLKVVLDNAIDCSDAVSPTYFFPLIVSSAVVRNSNLIDSTMRFGNFCRDLWFKSKSVLFNLDTLDYLASKNLVAGFHVR